MTRTNISGTSPYEPIIDFSVPSAPAVTFTCLAPVLWAQVKHHQLSRPGSASLIAAALTQAGSSLEHVVRTRIYLTHTEGWKRSVAFTVSSSAPFVPQPPWSS
jgi:hypothetical protein